MLWPDYVHELGIYEGERNLQNMSAANALTVPYRHVPVRRYCCLQSESIHHLGVNMRFERSMFSGTSMRTLDPCEARGNTHFSVWIRRQSLNLERRVSLRNPLSRFPKGMHIQCPRPEQRFA